MSESGKRVLRNSMIRMMGYPVGAGLFFATFVLVARYLGTEQFGNFSFIMAFVGIFQILADMGVRNILIRDIALDRENFSKHLSVARTLLWGLSLISLLLIALLSELFHFTAPIRHSVYIAGVAVIIIINGLGYSSVIRAFEEMGWDTAGFVLHKVVFIFLIWIVTHTDWGLEGVFLGLLAANGFQWIYFWLLVRIRHGRTPFAFDPSAAWKLFMEAFPLGVAEMLRRLLRDVDKFLLAILGTPLAVGLFSAPYKFLEAMNPLSMSLTLSLFPVISRLSKISLEEMFNEYRQYLKFLYAMGFPFSVAVFIFSERIVTLFFGEAYLEAAWVLRILAPSFIFLFPGSLHSYIFTALGRQRIYTVCIAIALAVNIVLDVILIPFHSYLGAAVGTLVAEIVAFLSGVILLKRMGGGLAAIWLLWRPFLSGLMMGLVFWWVRDAGTFLVVVGVCAGFCVYVGMLSLLKTFTEKERALLADAFRIKRN